MVLTEVNYRIMVVGSSSNYGYRAKLTKLSCFLL